MFESGNLPNPNEINQKIKNFLGNIKQTPPKVSAVKVNGQRAYKLTRQDKDFKILPKNVFVQNLQVINHDITETSFKIECGKGFYIRSLARDLAIDLKTFGHITSLERVKVGKFDKETSILLDDLIKIVQMHKLINCIKPTISMLDDILAYEILDQKDLEDLSLGRSIKIDENKLKKYPFQF